MSVAHSTAQLAHRPYVVVSKEALGTSRVVSVPTAGSDNVFGLEPDNDVVNE